MEVRRLYKVKSWGSVFQFEMGKLSVQGSVKNSLEKARSLEKAL